MRISCGRSCSHPHKSTLPQRHSSEGGARAGAGAPPARRLHARVRPHSASQSFRLSSRFPSVGCRERCLRHSPVSVSTILITRDANRSTSPEYFGSSGASPRTRSSPAIANPKQPSRYLNVPCMPAAIAAIVAGQSLYYCRKRLHHDQERSRSTDRNDHTLKPVIESACRVLDSFMPCDAVVAVLEAGRQGPASGLGKRPAQELAVSSRTTDLPGVAPSRKIVRPATGPHWSDTVPKSGTSASPASRELRSQRCTPPPRAAPNRLGACV